MNIKAIKCKDRGMQGEGRGCSMITWQPDEHGRRSRTIEVAPFSVRIERPIDPNVDDAKAEAFAHEVARAIGVEDRPKPLGPAYVRVLPSGALYMAGKRETGLAAFGYEYGDWLELLTDWDVHPTGFGDDKHGRFVEVSP